MGPPDPARIAGLLCDALEQPESSRAIWLGRACEGDRVLEAAVLQLLAIDRRTDLAIDQPLEALLPMDELSPEDEAAPERIGAFRILGKLGEGGMGSVWLAERVDGGFKQRVAIKLIRLGMDSAAVTRQFRRERDLLASLQHADIARLVDGGVDERGRPWFAMEHVEGTELREWSTRSDIGLRQRLALFSRLCGAVSYAHQRLIVHRDIKPSNIIVRADDAPCLLDFGIAKLLDESDGDASVTATHSGFLTRGYAAPEQLRGEPVTTGTDVFALGIVLFELLTGANYARLRTRDEVPARPSLALLLNPAVSTPTATEKQLRGDLDAITSRAMAEEPERRYPSAQTLADDIDNYLAGRAVRARPDGLSYRLGKFVRRNRAAVLVAAASFMALVLLSAVALWQARAKGIEAENARIALRRSESMRALLGSIFLTADPSSGKGAETTVGELLAPSLARIRRDAGDDPAVAAALLEQIGSAYVSLGEDELARQALSEALTFNRRASPPSLRVEGMATARLAYYRSLDGDMTTSLAELRTLVQRLRGGDPTSRPALALALGLMSHVLFDSEQVDPALAASTESLDLLQQLGNDYANEYVYGLIGHSDLSAAAGNNQDALDAANRALAHPLLQQNPPPGLLAAVLGANARALQVLGRHEEAEPMMERVEAAFTGLFGTNSGRTYYWRYRRAQELQALGRLDEAQAIVDAMIAQPANSEQPIAHVAYAVLSAQIARARAAPDADTRIANAVALACSDAGNARFCEGARALQQP